jgi:hypothetical protein
MHLPPRLSERVSVCRLKLRQEAHIQAVIPRARHACLTHLLHVDADEIVYAHEGAPALHAFLARHASAPDLHMQNLEALVPPHAPAGIPFTSCYAFRHYMPGYCAYSNGKSFGSLLASGALIPEGPHRFASRNAPSVSIPPGTSVVLHYESCSFSEWRDKYVPLSRSLSAAETDRVPFSFYRQSILLAAGIVAAVAAGDDAAASRGEEKAWALWRDWKMAPAEAERRAAQLVGGAGGSPPARLGSGARPCCALSCGVTLLWPFAPSADTDGRVDSPSERVRDLLLEVGIGEDKVDEYICRLAAVWPAYLLDEAGEALVAAAKKVGMPLGFRIKLRHLLRREGARGLVGAVQHAQLT